MRVSFKYIFCQITDFELSNQSKLLSALFRYKTHTFYYPYFSLVLLHTFSELLFMAVNTPFEIIQKIPALNLFERSKLQSKLQYRKMYIYCHLAEIVYCSYKLMNYKFLLLMEPNANYLNSG